MSFSSDSLQPGEQEEFEEYARLSRLVEGPEDLDRQSWEVVEQLPTIMLSSQGMTVVVLRFDGAIVGHAALGILFDRSATTAFSDAALGDTGDPFMYELLGFGIGGPGVRAEAAATQTMDALIIAIVQLGGRAGAQSIIVRDALDLDLPDSERPPTHPLVEFLRGHGFIEIGTDLVYFFD